MQCYVKKSINCDLICVKFDDTIIKIRCFLSINNINVYCVFYASDNIGFISSFIGIRNHQVTSSTRLHLLSSLAAVFNVK